MTVRNGALQSLRRFGMTWRVTHDANRAPCRYECLDAERRPRDALRGALAEAAKNGSFFVRRYGKRIALR